MFTACTFLQMESAKTDSVIKIRVQSYFLCDYINSKSSNFGQMSYIYICVHIVRNTDRYTMNNMTMTMNNKISVRLLAHESGDTEGQAPNIIYKSKHLYIFIYINRIGYAKGKESHQQNILEIRSALIKVHEFSTSTKIGKFYYISLECNKFTFRPREKKGIYASRYEHCVHVCLNPYHCVYTPQTQILYNQTVRREQDPLVLRVLTQYTLDILCTYSLEQNISNINVRYVLKVHHHGEISLYRSYISKMVVCIFSVV